MFPSSPSSGDAGGDARGTAPPPPLTHNDARVLCRAWFSQDWRRMNECGACGLDFGSLGAFDAHRVGRHAYSYSEGVAMSPLRENGRRCLRVWELESLGWARDSRGRWRRPVVDASVQCMFARRAA